MVYGLFRFVDGQAFSPTIAKLTIFTAIVIAPNHLEMAMLARQRSYADL